MMASVAAVSVNHHHRYKREVENYKDENRNLKQNKNIITKEAEELKKDTERLDRRLELLARFEEECHRLQEENSTLMKDSHMLQEQFESIVMEKENLEYQTQEALLALNDEREAKSLLETRLKEDSRLSPVHMTWAQERKENRENQSKDETKPEFDQEEIVRSSSSPPPHGANFVSKLHSTPYPSKNPPSLLSEIQESFMLETDKEELENLRKKLAEMEEIVCVFKKEKKVLENNVAASSVRESEQLKQLEGFKEKFAKESCEKDRVIEELNQRVIIRDEQIEQFRTKLSTATSEKVSMEIEVDGLSNEIQRLKVVSGIEVDKIQREHAQEQTKNIELRSQISVLEEHVSDYTGTVEKLENIVYNSQTELASMTEDIRSLQKAVATLNADGSRPSPLGTKPNSKPGSSLDGNKDTALYNGGTEEDEESSEPYYYLKIPQRKSSIQIHNETHSLHAVFNLREQLKMVRLPLEQFTRMMLEKSLFHSTKHVSPLSSSPDYMGTDRKNTLDLEAAVSKWKLKLMHKTEELSNLRVIMKARATTAEVATSSMRSKLEGQARAYQMELAKLKYQIKILKKERDEHLSLRTMYAKRCEDYIDEITKARKVIEKRKQEYDELMVSLQKTIRRKLELSTELEEYKMEQERKELIPRLLDSSRV